MKYLTRMLFAAAICASCVPAIAQDVGAAVFIDGRGQSALVTSQKITSLRNVAGRRTLQADVIAFAGVTNTRRPVFGFAATFDLRLADNAQLQLGPGITYSNARLQGVGIFAGIRIKV